MAGAFVVNGAGEGEIDGSIERGPNKGARVRFSVLAGVWYADDGHLTYDDPRTVRQLARACGVRVADLRRLARA